MNASALARSSSRSRLMGTTATGWPAVSASSLARVGISATQGPHQVAQRLSTTVLPLNSASVWVLPAASVKGTSGAGDGWASTTRAFMSPRARLFRSPGLEEQAGMTYRAAARPAKARALTTHFPYARTITRLMPPKKTDPRGHLLWGGRFSAKPDALMQAINVSIGFDRRLAAEDLAGSRAHAAMLAAGGIITAEDEATIQRGLATIAEEISAGTFPFREEFEDI